MNISLSFFGCKARLPQVPVFSTTAVAVVITAMLESPLLTKASRMLFSCVVFSNKNQFCAVPIVPINLCKPYMHCFKPSYVLVDVSQLSR
jgi:hypothetical protein